MSFYDCEVCGGDGFEMCRHCTAATCEHCDWCGGTGLGNVCEHCGGSGDEPFQLHKPEDDYTEDHGVSLGDCDLCELGGELVEFEVTDGITRQPTIILVCRPCYASHMGIAGGKTIFYRRLESAGGSTNGD